MSITIFFSWQSDRSTKAGRNFIERALERALGKIAENAEVHEAVREDLQLDRDTKGVPGTPPIVETIFKKIDTAAVFIPDVTFVGTRPDGRPTPNPNVLIEYGWALKSLGHSRMVPIMNTAHGEPSRENMPFDMAHLRNPITYCCRDDADEAERQSARDGLVKDLQEAISSILKSVDFKLSLVDAPAPADFEEKTARNGAPAMFRAAGEPLGIVSHGTRTPGEQVYMSEGAAFYLRVMPSRDPGKTWQIAELEEKARRGFFPMNAYAGSYDFIRSYDGWGIYPVLSDRSVARSVAFWFKSGEIWSIDADVVSEVGQGNAGIVLNEKDFAERLLNYVSLLQQIGVELPVRWIAGVQGIKGLHIWPSTRPGNYHHPFLRPIGRGLIDEIIKEGHYSEGDDPVEVLRPFFDSVFESFGVQRPA